MNSLIETFGLDWKLLLAQAVNFLILLTVLKFTVYKPLLELLAERRKRIETGLEKAHEADRRLAEITGIEREKMKQAEAKGLEMIRSAETKAKTRGDEMLAEAAAREGEMLARAKEKALAEEAAAMRAVESQAAAMVKEILVRTVKLKPEMVDEALIRNVAAKHTKE